MNQRDNQKLNEAIAGRVYDSLPYGPFEVGQTIEVDIRFGDEGPGSWTRCEAMVEQKHIDLAWSWAQKVQK